MGDLLWVASRIFLLRRRPKILPEHYFKNYERLQDISSPPRALFARAPIPESRNSPVVIVVSSADTQFSVPSWKQAHCVKILDPLNPDYPISVSSALVTATGFPRLGESGTNAADGSDAGRKPGTAGRKLPQITRRAGGLTLR